MSIPSASGVHSKTLKKIVAFYILILLFPGVRVSGAKDSTQEEGEHPSFENYATIEASSNGSPVYSFGNIAYLYGVSPDFYPDAELQAANSNQVVKIRPK